jgi:TonB-linked SusC/RagA family outer membrane protein
VELLRITRDEALPGVSIVIRGTTQGTVTNADGRYSISVPDDQSVLVFSFVGMQRQEITVQGRSVINVVMALEAIGVDEVVVTALGISRERKSLGYSVAEVGGEDIQRVVQENFMSSLSGRVAGVQIASTGGPGSSVSMVIRGASSLTNDNQPLYVVDGVPFNNTLANVQQIGDNNNVDYGSGISDINPQDIESITVLKGPSAAALYGSRAGNGVVLITTKTGSRVDALRVEVNSSTVLESPYAYLDMHSILANGQRPYTQDSRPVTGMPYYNVPAYDSYWCGPELDAGMMGYVFPYYNEAGELQARELVSYPNNFNDFFQTAFTTTNGFSVTNSYDGFNYRLSYDNMLHNGNIPNTDLNRNSIRFNSSARIFNNFTLNSSINYANSSADNRAAGNRWANPMENLYRRVNPSININDLRDYWAPGQEGLQQIGPYNLVINPDGTTSRGAMNDNPWFLAYEVNNSFRRDRISGFAQFEWQLLDGLMLMGRYAHDQYNESRETKIPTSYFRDPNGVYGITDIYRREQNADFLLSYITNFDQFSVSANAGGNYMHNHFEHRYDQTRTRGGGLTVPGIYSISNIAPENLAYGSSWSQKGIYSLYGLLSLGYADAVYLDLTARNDWSSTLPAENRSYFYPSASLSVLANNIVDMGPNVSLFKIRAGWAQVGNDTDPYRLTPVMQSQIPWDGVTRLSTSGTLLLPNLKPEIQTSWEIGGDLALFQNRLILEGTYYYAENENQILSIGLPPSSGWSGRQINAGLISSRGYELLAGGTPVRTNDWRVNLNFVYSWNRTRIEELAEGFNYIQFWGMGNSAAVTRVGDDIGQIVAQVITRVDDPSSPYHGWVHKTPVGGIQGRHWNQFMEPGDQTAVVGNYNPDFNLGMQTSVSFRSWTINANFDWRKGGHFMSHSYRYAESDYLTNRWIDHTVKINHLSPAERAEYLRSNADKYLLHNDDHYYVIVGGPIERLGGLPHTEGGITLNDGNFMPGVAGYYDNGSFVMTAEQLGDVGTPTIRWQSTYGWSYPRVAMFDADYIKLREVSLTYQLPPLPRIGVRNASVSVYGRNIILWTKAKIGIDPERAFTLSGNSFQQGIEWYNVNPYTIPVGVRLNVTF